MNQNNEGKNPPKKKDVKSTSKKQFVKPVAVLVKAGYRMVTGPYIPAKGDQN